MYQHTLKELAHGLERGEYSSSELTRYFLERINRLDGEYNAYITVDEALALKQATKADELRRQGGAGPLTGVPIAQKDIFCTQGLRTTCGSRALDNFIAPYDAQVIKLFKQAGTVNLGKTNMDEFAMGSSNENSYYGASKNPWDIRTVPGGSSGGSATAVAARLAPAATGTDTGGSIRQPAAFCGLTGLKPSYGRVSRYGMIAFASSLDQAGPMTQTAEDAALMMNVMAGYDAKDSTSLNHAPPDFTAQLHQSIDGITIGLPDEYFAEGLDNQIAAAIEQAITQFQKLGANVKSISLPHTHLSGPAYYVVAPAECSSNLSRFDGVRYGYRCENPTDLQDMYCRSRTESFGDEVKRRIMIGTYALSAGYFDAYYIKAQQIRRMISQDFNQAFEQVDVLIGPATPTTAFGLGEKTDDPISMYLSDIYTIGVNLAGLPAMSIPVGFANNLPVGMQLIGPYLSESKLLNIAHQFQLHTDWHSRLPDDID